MNFKPIYFTMTPTNFSEKLSHWLTLRTITTKPKTREFYSGVVEIIRREWKHGNPSADTITEMQVLEFAQRVTGECPSRWNQIVAALRYITPSANVLERRRLRVKQFDPPSQLLFDQFLADVDANPRTKAGLTIRFLFMTGLRKGEAFGLKWENVFADYIKIPAELCKSGVERTIPHLPELEEVLQRLRSIRTDEFVLPRENPRKVIECTSRRIFGKQWSLHSFRHLFATRCIEKGVPIPTVALWLGHQDKGVTLTKNYLHLIDEQQRREAAKVKFLEAPTQTLTIPPPVPPTLVYAMPSLNFQVIAA